MSDNIYTSQAEFCSLMLDQSLALNRQPRRHACPRLRTSGQMTAPAEACTVACAASQSLVSFKQRPPGSGRSPLTRLLHGLCMLLTICLSQHSCRAGIIASSSLESCVRSSSSDIQCQKKLVMTLSVGSGQVLATQQLDFQLSCIGSSTGECPCPCNFLFDSSCTCRDLESPVSVSITKTPMWASYPLQYIQSFNYKPYEIVVRPSTRECLAEDYEPNPTCGWYYVKGIKIPDSQGFTCSCDSSLIWDTTFGGSNVRTRANLDCDFWNDPLSNLLGKVPCSAHCLEFDPLWYSGYQLGAAALQFSIQLNLTVPGSGSVASSSEILELSPSLRSALSTDQMLSAQLLGDLATYTQLPTMGNMMLLIPQPQGQTIDQVLASNRSQWLLVDPSMMSMDGSTCDRVGTSFAAFRYQASACGRGPQVCLQNQIKDLIELDSSRIASGKPPLYLVTRYTYGSNSTLKSFYEGPISFALPVTSVSTSLVTLSISADNVRFVTNTAPGTLEAVKLCTFEEVTCGGFEAGAARGYLWMSITNTGNIASDYTVSVTNCSTGVLPIEARTVTLAPGAPTTLSPPIPIYVSDASADPGRYCWVTLFNSQGQVSDREMLKFYTNATVFPDVPTGGYNGTGDGVGEAKGAVDCSKVCSGAMDVMCFARNGCWRKMGGFIGLITGIATALGLLAFAAKAGMLASLFARMCGSGMSGGDGGGDDRRQPASRATRQHPSSSRAQLISKQDKHSQWDQHRMDQRMPMHSQTQHKGALEMSAGHGYAPRAMQGYQQARGYPPHGYGSDGVVHIQHPGTSLQGDPSRNPRLAQAQYSHHPSTHHELRSLPVHQYGRPPAASHSPHQHQASPWQSTSPPTGEQRTQSAHSRPQGAGQPGPANSPVSRSPRGSRYYSPQQPFLQSNPMYDPRL